MPIRALVVDDEPLARRNVTVLLRGDSDIGAIEECGSGAEAIGVIRSSDASPCRICSRVRRLARPTPAPFVCHSSGKLGPSL